jgi:hypothetical protein
VRSRFLVAAIVPALLVALSACSASASIGTPAMEKAQVEQKASEALAAQVGTAPDSIECPGDLEAKVGASMRCILTDGETKVGITTTVTSVEGTDVKFDVVVDDTPLPSSS